MTFSTWYKDVLKPYIRRTLRLSFYSWSGIGSLFLLMHVFGLQVTAPSAYGQTSPTQQFGHEIGADYKLVNYTEFSEYWQKLAEESPRMELVSIGKTAEGREQWMAIITAARNFEHLDRYREISEQLARAEISPTEANALAAEGKAIVWIDGGLHASEVLGAQQLIQFSYELVTARNQAERRALEETIVLLVHANPDGMELVSNWYMRKEAPKKRTVRYLPRLYHKYVGHDNNRDSYMLNMPETTNMSRIKYREWYPQILYNHHQPGPAYEGGQRNDIIVFVPPFRDPPNYTFDPLLVLGNQEVGTAMHSRLVEEGKPGSAARDYASYSTWFNGNVRTTGYYHHQIGILTEMVGGPTPMALPFFPDRQVASNDFAMPHEPGIWHFRQAVEYSTSLNWAVVEYTARNRERLLVNRYRMGRRSIQHGSRNHWTVTPDDIKRVEEEIRADETNGNSDERLKKAVGATVGYDLGDFRRRDPGSGLPPEKLEMLRRPEDRDPRGYILPSDQDDFPTAVKLVNTLIKSGVVAHRATEAFQVGTKRYPSGSLVVKTGQAFRPHVLSMFEPQDHPNDFDYPGGPPNPPYDNAGWTLAFQMGVEFDRILDGFSGPFEAIQGVAEFPDSSIVGLSERESVAGYLISHNVNNAFIATNRLIERNYNVYWLKEIFEQDEHKFPAGTIYIDAGEFSSEAFLETIKDLGLTVYAIEQQPQTKALKLNSVDVGLWDVYGGSMPSGWTRWLLEQFEFPFERVYPKTINAGNLKEAFDVLILPTGAIPPVGGYGEEDLPYRDLEQPDPEDIPEKWRSRLGQITEEESIPALQTFVRSGGHVVAIGSSTSLAYHLGVGIRDHLVNSEGESLEDREYFVPSSILETRVNPSIPLAYGMPERADVFFNNSPVFQLLPMADKKGVTRVAWFDSSNPLRSGWAWGQRYLYGGVAIAQAEVGNGVVNLFGPEIVFRGQPHGTYKFLFNAIHLSNAEDGSLAK